MKKEDLAKYFDHTLLKPNAIQKDYDLLIEQGNQFKFASLCIPPSWVTYIKRRIIDEVKVCSVLGFPLGYNSQKAKIEEAKSLLDLGCDEIDMVMNISEMLNGNSNYIKDEISQIRDVCANVILKVIVETAYLEKQHIIQLCHILEETQVDYFKTSTGFASKGAQLEDLLLAKENLKKVKIKASGGISDLETTLKFIQAGADRIGASKSHLIVKA